MLNQEMIKLTLSKKEIIALYIILKSKQGDYKQPIISVLKKIEKHIYSILTIEEMENIEQLYNTCK